MTFFAKTLLRDKERSRRQKLNMQQDEFYLRYYIGHDGRFGHEFMEFEVYSYGLLRYANNSNYKKDMLIRKEVTLQPIALEELRKIIRDSAVLRRDDGRWPEPDDVGNFNVFI